MDKQTRSKLIDEILRFLAISSVTATALLAPNALQVLDKPLEAYLKKLDHKQRKRELSRILSYMKYEKLVSDNYEHGLHLTNKAKKRLRKADINSIRLNKQTSWDGKWRIIFFDIPEARKSQRDAFAAHIRRLGFIVLQRSVFIYPYESRHAVEKLASYYSIEKYVTYIETDYIDKQELLLKRFNNIIK